MSTRRPITFDLLSRARELRDEGMKWSRISARLGVSEDALRRRCDQRYAEHRNSRVRAWRSSGGKLVAVTFDPPPAPQDTRNLTARVMGDPLPGRSALDKKRNFARAIGPLGQASGQKRLVLREPSHAALSETAHKNVEAAF